MLIDQSCGYQDTYFKSGSNPVGFRGLNVEHLIAPENPLPHSRLVSRRPVALLQEISPEILAEHHRQQTSSLLRVFSGFDCDDDDMVNVDKLCLALHRLGFKVATNELETSMDEAAMDDNEAIADLNFSEAFKIFDEDDDGSSDRFCRSWGCRKVGT
ncbi:hypothetical protein ACLOJK_025950 [Asimina triloba]